MAPLLTNTNPAHTHLSISAQHEPMSPLLTSTHPAHTHVSIAHRHPTGTHLANTCLHLWPTRTHVAIAYQHSPSTHPCLHCSPAPIQRTRMSPSLANTHPWLHCSPAPTERTHMSPSLASTHPAHTHVSISGQQAPTNAHQGHCCVSPGRGLSTSTPKLSEICYFTNLSWPPGFPYCNL